MFFVLPADLAHWITVFFSVALPFRVFPLLFLPALLLFLGHIPAQDARCAADGNWLMSVPISARIVCTVESSSPGTATTRRIGVHG